MELVVYGAAGFVVGAVACRKLLYAWRSRWRPTSERCRDCGGSMQWRAGVEHSLFWCQTGAIVLRCQECSSELLRCGDPAGYARRAMKEG